MGATLGIKPHHIEELFISTSWFLYLDIIPCHWYGHGKHFDWIGSPNMVFIILIHGNIQHIFIGVIDIERSSPQNIKWVNI
jgi:hypothetical protein